jgi:O-antigen/teichoic acid export membrane protein
MTNHDMPSVKEQKTDDEVVQLARGGTFSLIGQAANALLTFGFFALCSHALLQVQAGGLFEAMAIVTTASLIATCGADIGLMRFLPKYRRHGSRQVKHAVLVATIPCAIVGAILAVVLFVMAPEIAGLLVHHEILRSTTARQLRLLAPIIPLTGVMTALLAGSRAWGITPSVAVQYLFIPVLRPILFGAFFLIGITSVLAAAAWGIPVALAFLAAMAVMARALARTRKTIANPADATSSTSFAQIAREFWTFSAPRFLEGILTVFLWGVDIVLVGALASPKLAASYTIATRYIAFSILGLQAVLVAIPTRISDLMHRGARTGARELYRVATWWTVAISWPPAIALAVFAPFFMSLFGRGYESGNTALAILSLGVIASTLSGPCGAVLLMSGKTSVSLASTVLAVGINIPLSVFLIPKYGATGAAIAWTVSAAVTSIVQSVMLWRIFKMHPFGSELAVVGSASFICFGVYGLLLRVTLGTDALSFGLYVLGAVSSYCVVMLSVRRLLRLEAFGQFLRPSGNQDPPKSNSRVGNVTGGQDELGHT